MTESRAPAAQAQLLKRVKNPCSLQCPTRVQHGHAPLTARSPVCRADHAARRGAEARQALPTAVRARGRTRARARPAVSPAERHGRPACASGDPRRGAGQRRNDLGHRRPPPAAAAEPLARAVPDLRQRRHRRPDPHLLPRQARLPREAPAGGRAAHRLGHHRALRRHAADGASRSRGERSRTRKAAAGRAGLSADRRADDQRGAQGGGRGADQGPAPAGMAGRRRGSSATAFRPSPRRCTRCTVPPIRPTSCPRARPGRGSPTTNSSPASSRSRWFASTSARCPAAAAPAKASCARG